MQHLGDAMSHQLFSTNRGGGRTTRLLVTVTGEHAVKYPLYKDVMVIGRSTDSDIQVQGQYTSRHHARICSDNDGSFVEDLDSKNGVRVNEQSIRRQRLRDGDMVDVGGAKLRFIDLATRKAASAA
jgi:pSer/pThr/pTyr-binding forkhead associated (FHA) protein